MMVMKRMKMMRKLMDIGEEYCGGSDCCGGGGGGGKGRQ